MRHTKRMLEILKINYSYFTVCLDLCHWSTVIGLA